MVISGNPADVAAAYVKEEWREIPGYDGFYEVSSFGNVRSMFNTRRRRLSVPRLRALSIRHDGYMGVTLSSKVTSRNHKVHRLVMLAFVGPSELGVNHIDGNPTNNHLANLEYVTQADNNRHAVEVLGRKMGAIGEAHPNAKLTNLQVIEIRRLYSEGFTQKELMGLFGVADAYISRLVRGHYRKDIL